MKTVDEHVSMWRREPEQRIQAFEKWDDEEIEKFSHIQWWMLVPMFDINSLDCQEFTDETILPFIPPAWHDEDRRILKMKMGGHSEVTAFRVHPAHHNFWDASIPRVSSLIML